MTRRQIQARLDTIMVKLDEVVSGAATSGALDPRDMRRLVQARELVLAVEGPLYDEGRS